jgi:hypothetical protein
MKYESIVIRQLFQLQKKVFRTFSLLVIATNVHKKKSGYQMSISVSGLICAQKRWHSNKRKVIINFKRCESFIEIYHERISLACHTENFVSF